MRIKLVLAAAALVASATMVSAHLPSANDARFAIDREKIRMGQQQGGKLRADTYSNKGEWKADVEYKGNAGVETNPDKFAGDTVSYGEWNGKKLWWWAKFWTKGDLPGESTAGGGTSPWVLINSLSVSANNGKPNYQWKGWEGSISAGQVMVPTWKNGAKGAYSMTHDDIGSMPYDLSVEPAYVLAKNNAGFEGIKQSWGVFVGKMTDDDWKVAIKMVADGHEMFNHSMDHTSAAEGWQWFWPGTNVPAHDPAIPAAIRGLTVTGTWHPKFPGQEWAPAPNVQTFENQLLTLTAETFWTGTAPSTLVLDPVKSVNMKAGTQKLTILGVDLYVNYTERSQYINADGSLKDGVDPTSPEIVNKGFIAATGASWWGLDDFQKYGSGPAAGFSGNADYPDGGPGFIAKVRTSAAWDNAAFKLNMKDANDVINAKIYERINNPGKYFKVGKRSEYYGYPLDLYSQTSHKKLQEYDIPAARGGGKSGTPMLGDFFHPYGIDFDAFWIDQKDWTPDSKGAKYVFPGNPHVRLGLNEMVEKIIEKKGYMIREFHAVADIQGDWFDNTNDAGLWPINNSGKGQGGWWGGITKNQLEAHYNFLKSKIDAGDLVVFTASEAVSYRLTANSVSGASLSGNTLTATLDPSNKPQSDRHQNEISFIVGITADKLNVEYPDGSNPRLAPKNLGNGAWAVNFNPYVSTSVTLFPGQDFVDPKWDGPDTSECKWWELPEGETCPDVSVSKLKVKQNTSFAFTGISNGQINLRLTAGNYSVSLYNLQGRVVGTANISAVNGVNATGLKTTGLAKGMLILKVKDAKGASVLQNKIMIK